MILAYIVNHLKSIVVKNDVIKTVHHEIGTESGNGIVAKCSGYSLMSIKLDYSWNTGGNFRTVDIFIEGQVDISSPEWIPIPVYNSKKVWQPYICIKNAPATSKDIGNMYYADVSGFGRVRARMDFVSGTQGIGVTSYISNNPFKMDRVPVTVRDMTGITSIVPRDFDYIGRQFAAEGGKTDGNNLYPIWIGDCNYCEIIIKNNLNKTIRLDHILMHNDIATPVNKFTNIYSPYKDILPGKTLKINSVEYPLLIAYLGISMHLRQFRGEGETTGSYDLKINIK